MIFEAKKLIYTVDQSGNALDLVTDLLRRHKDMSIILSKAAHTHQAVKLTGFFVTVNQSKLSHSQRKISVGTWFRFVYKNTSRAVHWLNGKISLVNYSCIHIFFVMIPVA